MEKWAYYRLRDARARERRPIHGGLRRRSTKRRRDDGLHRNRVRKNSRLLRGRPNHRVETRWFRALAMGAK